MSILKILWNFFFAKKKPEPENIKEELYAFKEKYFEEEDEEKVCRYCLGKKQMLFKGVMTNCPECNPVDVSKQNNLIPSRFEGESFAEYKKRQALAKLFLKKKQKGEMVFVSKDKLLKKGKTFTKSK